LNNIPSRITSLQNDQVKALVRLRTRRERDLQQLFLIEEPLVIARALAAGHPMNTLFYCDEMVKPEDQELLQTLLSTVADFVEVNGPVMDKISYREHSAGLLVVAPQQEMTLAELDSNTNSAPLFIVLEGVEKPGNLGAVLRVADGAGADAVIICGQGADVSNPNVLRASRGANFSVPKIGRAHV